MVNAGGVIQVADEIDGFNFDRAKVRATKIYDTTRQILQLADAEGVPPAPPRPTGWPSAGWPTPVREGVHLEPGARATPVPIGLDHAAPSPHQDHRN